MQRLRIKFSRGEEVKFISHLDIMRFWHRAFRRAEIPLAYSQGFTPHPKIALAAPLPVGITSEAELMDIVLRIWMPPQSLLMLASKQLPPGFNILDVQEITLNAPSLQSIVSHAEYRLTVRTERTKEEIANSITSLLSAAQIPWQRVKETGTKNLDLRPLIETMRLVDCHASTCTLEMKLKCGAGGSGRAEEVASALGLTEFPESIHRTALFFSSGKGESFPAS
jgi:radical SAM-linked protein